MENVWSLSFADSTPTHQTYGSWSSLGQNCMNLLCWQQNIYSGAMPLQIATYTFWTDYVTSPIKTTTQDTEKTLNMMRSFLLIPLNQPCYEWLMKLKSYPTQSWVLGPNHVSPQLCHAAWECGTRPDWSHTKPHSYYTTHNMKTCRQTSSQPYATKWTQPTLQSL